MKILIAWLSKGFAFCVYALPVQIKYLIGDMLGCLWFDIFRIRRNVILDNISKVYPEKSLRKKTKLARMSLRNMGRDLVEYSYLPFFSQIDLDKMYEFEGEEHISAALAEGKGVCLLTLHLGNGDLALAALSKRGYPVYLISKEFKIKWLNELWFGMREKVGARFIPPRNSSYAVLKALKKNAAVIFVLDQFTGPPIGVKTTFFGHETGTGLGLALIAERADTPVVPVYSVRRPGGKHLIHFDRAIDFENKDDRDESLVYMTQKYNHQLEKYILAYPEQWMWVHRRWKTYKL